MKRKAILCVDDEIHVLNSLKRLLRKEDYELRLASSGEEGLLELEKDSVQVVVSDQRMPGMAGTEFLKIVKERYPDTVRVVLSGYADVQVIVAAINEGEIFRFLVKPWNDEELKATIRQCLDQYDLISHNHSLVGQIQSQNEELKRLNEELETTVILRTESLGVVQEILSKLPIPVVGVDCDFNVALVNRAAVNDLPFGSQILPGQNFRKSLPEALVALLERCVADVETRHNLTFEYGGRVIRVRIEKLATGSLTRGCILIFEGEDEGERAE